MLYRLWHINENTRLGLWQINEEEAYFTKRIYHFADIEQQLIDIKGRRHLESLAVRYLLQYMCNDEATRCLKDEYGKPYLDGMDIHVSLSHTSDWAAVVLSEQLVGLDIQRIVAKITRLAPKFMRPEEMENIHPTQAETQLCMYWSAKEALYKAYGKRQLDFREHIIVQPFIWDNLTGTSTGQVIKDGVRLDYTLHYELIEDMVLVCAIQV